MKILRKSSALQSHLSSITSKLRPSTTLIISSAPAPPKEDNAGPRKTDQELQLFHTGIENQIGQCQFATSMQFNLKTISYGNKTLSGAYPTKNNIDAALELMRRTGATNVIGVGTGPVMDLAKACYYKNREEFDSLGHDQAQLILNPGTLGATLAAASKECLMLCPEEEALLPYYSTHTAIDATTIVLDDKVISVPSWCVSDNVTQLRSQRGNNATITDSALASIVIAIDAAHALGDVLSDEKEVEQRYRILLEECVASALDCIKIMDGVSMNDPAELKVAIQTGKEHAITSMLNAGQLLSFGNVASLPRRNVSLAMTSALLPTYFPFGNWLSFTASLLPGLCRAIEESDEADDNELLRGIAAKITASDESYDSLSRMVEWADRISSPNESSIVVPSLSSLAEGAPDPNELVMKVEDNGAFLNCADADSTYIESLLFSSLNR
jgi:hypothetical protein